VTFPFGSQTSAVVVFWGDKCSAADVPGGRQMSNVTGGIWAGGFGCDLDDADLSCAQDVRRTNQQQDAYGVQANSNLRRQRDVTTCDVTLPPVRRLPLDLQMKGICNAERGKERRTRYGELYVTRLVCQTTLYQTQHHRRTTMLLCCSCGH